MGMFAGSWAKKIVATRIVAADGSGDFTDIQSAIDDLPAGGGVVYVKEGTYTITSAITIGVSNTALIGAGKATKVQTTSDITMLYASALSGIHINKLYFYGAGDGKSSNLGIEFVGMSFSSITECWIDNCGSLGIGASGESQKVIITDNVLNANFSTGMGLTDFQYGICSDNVIVDSSASGILSQSIAWSVLSNNVITGSGDHGINVATHYGTVSNNVCDQNTECGIILSVGGNSTIIGNICRTNTQHGIYLNASRHNTVIGNFCEDNDSGNSQTYSGIMLDSESDNNTITGNRCRNNDNYEIDISASTCDNNIVVGNHCIGTDHEGAINDSGTNTQIGHNVTA